MDFVKFLFVIFKVCWFIKSSLAKAHREQIQTRGVLNSYKKTPSVFAYQNKLYKKKKNFCSAWFAKKVNHMQLY